MSRASLSDLSASGGAGRCPGDPSLQPLQGSPSICSTNCSEALCQLRARCWAGGGGSDCPPGAGRVQTHTVCLGLRPSLHRAARLAPGVSASQAGIQSGLVLLHVRQGRTLGPSGGPCAHMCSHAGPRTHARRWGAGLRPQVWPPICRGRRLNGAGLRGSRPFTDIPLGRCQSLRSPRERRLPEELRREVQRGLPRGLGPAHPQPRHHVPSPQPQGPLAQSLQICCGPSRTQVSPRLDAQKLQAE